MNVEGLLFLLIHERARLILQHVQAGHFGVFGFSIFLVDEIGGEAQGRLENLPPSLHRNPVPHADAAHELRLLRDLRLDRDGSVFSSALFKQNLFPVYARSYDERIAGFKISHAA